MTLDADALDVEIRRARKSAVISVNLEHRYLLTRTRRASSGALPDLLAFVMLNPSTADDETDDQTIRRCMMIAWREGFDGIEVCNLRSFRAREPKVCAAQPRSPVNWMHLETTAEFARKRRKPIVCGWGAATWIEEDARRFVAMAAAKGATLRCLGKTRSGAPRHPCYIANNQPLEPYP